MKRFWQLVKMLFKPFHHFAQFFGRVMFFVFHYLKIRILPISECANVHIYKHINTYYLKINLPRLQPSKLLQFFARVLLQVRGYL